MTTYQMTSIPVCFINMTLVVANHDIPSSLWITSFVKYKKNVDLRSTFRYMYITNHAVTHGAGSMKSKSGGLVSEISPRSCGDCQDAKCR